jgi:ribonuclease P protein subunit POP4
MMMTTPANVIVHEIIGLEAMIMESTDPSLQGVRGSIVFETRNTISIRTVTDSSIKQIAKKAAKRVQIKTHSGVCFISGSSMIGRPEDRISRLNN